MALCTVRPYSFDPSGPELIFGKFDLLKQRTRIDEAPGASPGQVTQFGVHCQTDKLEQTDVRLKRYAGKGVAEGLTIRPIRQVLKAVCFLGLNQLKASWLGFRFHQHMRGKGEITNDFGQILSWDYLVWARQYPIQN